MHRRRRVVWVGSLVPFFLAPCLLTVALSRPALAQTTQGCPIPKAEYGTEVQRTFTDSKGRKAQVFFKLPVNHNPDVATGILMYFHGNDTDPTDSYVAPLYEIQDRADAHGFIAAGLKSIGTRVNPDGTVVREWMNTDGRLLNELLLSNFGGCFKLDRARVYLEGASQGTCFLAASLTIDLWRSFQGGVIGLCGCWGQGEFDYPVNVPTLRDRWKVLVQNTTEDFLHQQGVMGLDIFKYNFGMDVRADLSRPGDHCVDTRVNAAAALTWMTGKLGYPDADANQPHWQMISTLENGLEDVAYDAKGARFVLGLQRADPTDAVREQIEKVRGDMFAEDPPGFLDWRLTNYPEYAMPPVLILTTTDYGATFTQVARRESTGNENLWDVTVTPDGSILVVVQGLGLRKVNEATKTIEQFAFPNMLIYELDHDDAGNVFAHGAVIRLQRSRDNGATWTELTVPVRNNNVEWTVNTAGGTLAVIGSDGRVYASGNGGDTFTSAALPTGVMVDFANHGQNFYAVMNDGTVRVSQNAGTSWRQATVPGDTARAVEVLPNGDVVIASGPAARDLGMAYRSKDVGVIWTRERGAHNNARMEFAGGKTNEIMMVTTRGVFRYSTGPLLNLGTALPPIAGTGGNSGAGGVGSGTGGAGITGSGGVSGPGTGGTTTLGTGGGPGSGSGGGGPNAGGGGGGGGCGCGVVSSPDTRGLHAWGMLGILAALAIVRSRSMARAAAAVNACQTRRSRKGKINLATGDGDAT